MQIHTRALLVLFGTVFITGAAVLIVEVAAVRVLTPIFGGSIYVLSSVLTVILLALSIGYFVGGRIADRHPNPYPLYLIIAGSGLLLLLLTITSQSVLSDTGTIFSPLLGPLIFSLLLFFVPACLLGMDSPYVITLLSHYKNAAQTGRFAGTTFFWSTLGSISGSIAAGFWLIPSIGVTTTIISVSLFLIILGISAPFLLTTINTTTWDKVWPIISIVIIVVTLFALAWYIRDVDTLPENVILEYDGLYSRIRVEEFNLGTPTKPLTLRALRRDTNNSSASYLENTDFVHAYTQFADLYDTLVDNPKTLLVLGGGAYTIPRHLVAHDAHLEIEVVEIEPTLFALAQSHFGLSDVSRITNHVSDARVFLDANEKEFDVIFTDTMASDHNIPFHLTTLEYYESLRRALAPEGVVISNYIGTIDPDPESLTARIYHTLQHVFTHVDMYQVTERDYREPQNIMFISYNTPEPKTAPEYIISQDESSSTLADLGIDTKIFNTNTPLLLTDDHAPVEYLMAQQMNTAVGHLRSTQSQPGR